MEKHRFEELNFSDTVAAIVMSFDVTLVDTYPKIL